MKIRLPSMMMSIGSRPSTVQAEILHERCEENTRPKRGALMVEEKLADIKLADIKLAASLPY